MATAKVTIDTSPLYEAAANILNRAGQEWLKAAQKAAPVRKPDTRPAEPGSRSEQLPIRLNVRTTGLSRTQQFLRSEIEEKGRNVVFRRLVQRHGARANLRLAKLFVITKGAHKGQAPALLVETKSGRLAGIASKGGTLRAGLELIPARREGNLVTVTLQNLVPYAAPQEYGFKHKGTGQIPGRRFMRGPRDNEILPALRAGQYNRG